MLIRLKTKNFLKRIGLFKYVKKIVVIYRSRFNKMEIGLDGKIDLPTEATVELTLNCNLNCRMCFQKSERKRRKRDLNFSEFVKVLDNFNSKIKRISFIGGEIFAHPDIFEILEECDKRNIDLRLTTNATLLGPEKIERLKKLKHQIKGIGVSLDGLKETHDRIRGVNGAFDRAIKVIGLLTKDFTVNVNCVVFKDNLQEIIPLIKLLQGIGLVNFSLQFELFSTQKEVDVSARMLNLPQEAIQLQHSEDSDYSFSYSDLEKFMVKIRKTKGIDIMIQPTLFNKYPEFYYQGSLRSKMGLICKDLFKCRIDSRGNLTFCFIIKKEIGNLIDESLESIWNNEAMRNLRIDLSKGNLTPVCKRCCRLGLLKKK